MSAKKIKAAADGWKENFSLEKINCGPDTTSLFANKTGDVAKDSGLPPTHICKTILDEIRRMWDAGDPFSTSVQSRSQGRNIYTHIKQRYSIDDKKARNMIEGWLLPDSLLKVDMINKNTKRMGLRVVGSIGETNG